MLKRLFYCFLFAFAAVTLGYAQQTPTTQGTEFWLSFMRNGYRTSSGASSNNLTLIASAKHACTVTVTNSYTGYTNTFSVPDQGVHTLQIPDAAGYNDQQSGVANKGLLVTSTDTISLYIANETQNSYDAANVLPIQALGYSYMAQSNKSLGEQSSHANENRASILIVATEDNTEVQITPSCMTWESHSPGEPYSVTLQRGQCYHVLNKNTGYESNGEGDFSGTWIESVNNKRIAVFNGNCITSVADGAVSEGLDHVFEQAMPVDNWGTRFVLTKTATPSSYSVQNDRVKITALFDNTIVRRGDGSQLCRLSAGGSYAFWMTETCCYLESNNPVAIYLYNHSHSSSNTYGDPSMVWISPVQQNLREVIFSTFSSSTNLNHFVNVVCFTDDAAELCLNNTPIAASQIHAVPDAPQYSYARVPVSAGMNRLSCPSGLVAHVYGMGDRQGYAYTVGSSARILTNQLLVNGGPVVDEYITCQFEMLDFRMETNYDPDQVKWNFGDNSPEELGVEVSHAYDKPGHFYVEAVVDHEVNGAPQSDTLRTTIHVDPLKEYDEEPWTTCGTSYLYHGVDYPVPGDYDVFFETAQGCDSIVHIHLIQGNEVVFHLDPIAACESYEWFGETYTATDHHLEHRVPNASPEGCDSLYILDLTISFPPENPVRYMSSCTPYDWDGVNCDVTDVYYHQYETEEHCLYDSVLHFTRHYEPPFDQIMGLSQVAVATNFWPGQYSYYLDDSLSMNTSRIHWELLDNPEGPGQWDFRPHGASCTIVAYSMGTRTLYVTSGDGFCDKEAYKTINCTGYGVDEHELVNLEVYPNPVRDELVVKCPEMSEIILYNLLGQKMQSVPVNGDAEAKVEVSRLPQALYLLEVRTRRGNKTQLVSVIK